MVNESRMDVYDYVEEMLSSVTENIYPNSKPQELTDDDVENGFIVVNVSGINDESEFRNQAYGNVRVFVSCYIPPISRGRLNKELYQQYETGVTEAINNAIESNDNDTYSIDNGSIIAADDVEDSGDNFFHVLIKSFVIIIN